MGGEGRRVSARERGDVRATLTVTRRARAARLERPGPPAETHRSKRGEKKRRGSGRRLSRLAGKSGRGADTRDLTRGVAERAPRCAEFGAHASPACTRDDISGGAGGAGRLTWMATKKRPPW